MRTLGNILWLIFGGFISAIAWFFSGIIWCITIVGIPYGLQCFKFAKLTLTPFTKDIEYNGGVFSSLVNIIWFIFFGWEMALGYLVTGVLWCITIIGIPYGFQFFKLARLAIAPFGSNVVGKE